MNILVLLRVGRDPASFTVNRKAQKIFIHRDEYRVNPSDLNALEAALQLGDAGHAVTAVCIGGPEAQEVLYQARAMGAVRALWCNGAALADADAGQSVAVIQKALGFIGGADFVLLGATVRHADLAQVGPRLAATLGWPLVEGAQAVEVDGSSVTAAVADGEVYLAVQAGLPAVVTVAEDSNQPRFAPATNIIRAYAESQTVEVLSAADLGLDEPALTPQTVRRGERYPAERMFGKKLEGSAEAVARHLIAALRE